MAAPDPAAPAYAFEVVPDAKGPPMLMVHGMLSSRYQWQPNLPALKAHVTPVLVELWGHGQSPTPDAAHFEALAMVEALDAVRQQIGADKVLLCGQSLGAGITLRYSLVHPQHTIAQVFTNSTAAMRTEEEQGTVQQREAHADAIRAEGIAALHRMHFHPRRARRLPEELREFLVAVADKVDPLAAANIIEITSPGLSIRDQLKHIACPTLIVNGGFERGFQPARDFAVEQIPACQVVDLEAGHAVNLEEPQAFDAAVIAFLQTLNL